MWRFIDSNSDWSTFRVTLLWTKLDNANHFLLAAFCWCFTGTGSRDSNQKFLFICIASCYQKKFSALVKIICTNPSSCGETWLITLSEKSLKIKACLVMWDSQLTAALISCIVFNMMTSSNGNIFRITGPLYGSPADSPHKIQWRRDLIFLCAPEQTAEQIIQMLVIWDAIMTSL